MSSTQVTSSADSRIEVSAHRLAVQFTEDANLPVRYRRTSDSSRKTRKANDDSDIEKRFRTEVNSWRDLLKTMLSKVDAAKAWRFIDQSPQFTEPLRQVTDNDDFCDFLEYMRQRRDVDAVDTMNLAG